MAGNPFAFGMLRRREVAVPTWRGWLLLVLLTAAAFRGFLAWVHPFLAINAPIGGEALVVEGWIPDYALRQALAEFRARGYPRLIVTGGPLPGGSAFSRYGDYARLGSAALQAFGLPADSIAEAPSPRVRKDRTFAEGLALAAWMGESGSRYRSIDLFSYSAHARRSRLLYGMALGGGVRVGVFSAPSREYDAGRWWASSAGFREVTDEGIAYLYAKLAFRGR